MGIWEAEVGVVRREGWGLRWGIVSEVKGMGYGVKNSCSRDYEGGQYLECKEMKQLKKNRSHSVLWLQVLNHEFFYVSSEGTINNLLDCSLTSF